ncbi:hypothetical protein [Parerythrobacter aestuarii]|uniref:hypothetical protein n=1 Tax=Parerythrobacter aestuarii TaxID=3020909 RepID=UPI0024DE3267|nr:hypothetical protein [Parerythrobacter aestuarii]
MKLTNRKTALIAGAAAVAAFAVPAVANHAWSNYHWERTGDAVTVPVIDNTTGIWAQRNHTGLAVADWNQSPVIDAPLLRGNADPSCAGVANQINVCNDDYGNTGWLGIASISISRGRSSHITAGITKLNDYYFNQPQYNNDTWRQLVTCQEIGHDYGLGHQNEDFSTDLTTSCMEYTSQPAGNESPDAHDYEQLLDIYAHSDGGSGGPGGGKGGGKKFDAGNHPSNWGQAIAFDAKGRPNVYRRVQGNEIIVTHVTWAIGEGPSHDH